MSAPEPSEPSELGPDATVQPALVAASGDGSASPMVPGRRSLVRRSLRPVLKVWLRLQVADVGHVPTSGPVLVASTHQSHADSVALAVAIERPIHFLGDVRLTTWPGLGPQLPKLGMVPLQRGTGDASALDVLRDLLGEGAAVAVYPEGSRSRDGRVHRLRSGVARLAADTGAQVVPAAVAGIYDVWPIGARPRLRGGRVTVRFGEPIPAPGASPLQRRVFTDELHRRLVELSGCEPANDFSPAGGVA